MIIKESKFGHFLKCVCRGLIDHFTVAGGNEARVDLFFYATLPALICNSCCS